MTIQKKFRRKQEDRSSETRRALFEATIAVICEKGYAGASTALIAERAKVTRGAVQHQFGTRVQLMAEVVRWVYDNETDEYSRATPAAGRKGLALDDWPAVLWRVLGKPSGIAVLDILWATRSDPELAERVLPLQQELERLGLERLQRSTGADPAMTLAQMRLLVWSVRGLVIAQSFVPNPDDVYPALDLLTRVLRRAAPSGAIEEIFRDAG